MATAESLARTEMATAHNLYRRAQRSSKANYNGRCMRFLRKAKRKPVLHMLLFFLLITISVVVILIVVLTTWPGLEKEFSETNSSRYGYEDTALFRIPTKETYLSNVSTETKHESTELFEDSSPDESNITHESIDLDADSLEKKLTSVEYPVYNNDTEDDLKIWLNNDVTFNGSDESGRAYYWDVSPSAGAISTENISRSFELDSDQEEDKISFYYGPELTIDTSMFTHTLKETTTEKISQIYTHPITQLSALLTLKKSVDIKPSTVDSLANPAVVSTRLDTLNSTELFHEFTLYTEKPQPSTIQSSIAENNNIKYMGSTIKNNLRSSAIDPLDAEHNFWSSLANLSLAKFPLLMFSNHTSTTGITTPQLGDANLTTALPFTETVRIDDGSDYSIRYVFQISSTQMVTATSMNGTVSVDSPTKGGGSALSPSEAEYNHWPTSGEDMTLSELVERTNVNVVKEITSSISTESQKNEEVESTPSEVEFFPSTETKIPKLQITPTIDNSKMINSSVVSGWGFGNNNNVATATQTDVSPQSIVTKSSTEGSQCRRRTLSFCDDVSSYNSTYLPNLAGATTEFEKWQLISYYNSVVDWGCNLWLKEYLCYILEPMCVDEVAVPPCNSLCKAAKKGCEKFVTGSPTLEAVFRCDVFPSATAQILCAGLGNGEACKHNEYRCSDTTCIPGTWWCDGVKDCEQGDDEKDCHPRNRNP